MTAAAIADEGPGGLVDVDAMTDEVRQAVESHLRSYERSWVDESIPMFGGLTPRQALEDPTSAGPAASR